MRTEAAGSLGKIGPISDGEEAIVALLGLAKDPERLVRNRGVQALTCFGEAAVPALVEALGDPDPDVRWFAAETLSNLGPHARAAFPDLSWSWSQGCACASGSSGSGKGPGLPDQPHGDQALGRIGPPALPVLVSLLEDPDRSRQREAVRALGQVGEAALSVLTALTRNSDPWVRRSAAEALARLGPGGPPPSEGAPR